jgi:hypothetical protein
MTIVILSLLAVTISLAWFIARRRHRAVRARADLPLFSVPLPAHPGIPRPSVRAPAPVGASLHGYSSTDVAPDRIRVDARPTPPVPRIRTRDGAVSSLPHAPSGIGRELQMDEEMGEPVDGASVRYWRAADGTLQFLPGRLEIAAGRDAGQEIRFVRTSGPDGTCVTFGRADGPPYRHVQLREPTVSRAHARMALEAVESPNTVTRGSSGAGAARWRLENLSATNPVIVNGRPLEASGDVNSSVILSDGDRIEMGEVAFVFRER